MRRRRRSRSLSCQSRSVVSFVHRRPSANTEVNDLWKGARAGERASGRACKRVNGRSVGTGRSQIRPRTPARPPLFKLPKLQSWTSCFVRSGTAKPNFLGKTSPPCPIRQPTARAVRRRGDGRGGPRQSGKAMSPGKKRERGSGNEKYWSRCCCSTMNRAASHQGGSGGWIG